MKKLSLEQGSDQWLDYRLTLCCASEAPAMMGKSKHMTRNELLDIKKGWQKNPIPSYKAMLFQKAHESEDAARAITEMEHCEDFPPIVGSNIVEGMELLASFDGLGELGGHPWEHKEWNATLAENVRNCTLEPHYYWQLEHQALVAGTRSVYFTCSDGGNEKRISMTYDCVPERTAALIAGWKQFLVDLEDHEIEPKQEVIIAREVNALPVIKYRFEGQVIISNIDVCLVEIKERATTEINRKLETDLDFADKDKLNKATREARAKLKNVVAAVEGEFVSYSEFASIAAQIDDVLQKMQSSGEKQVKQQKDAKKKAIMDANSKNLAKYLDDWEKELPDHIHLLDVLPKMPTPDFPAAMKNKRTIESLESAASEEVAGIKVEVHLVLERVLPNIEYLDSTIPDFWFLFTDARVFNQDQESFQAVAKSRLETEKKRLDAEREKIREQEKEKLEQEAADKKAEEEKAEQDRKDQEAADQLAAANKEAQDQKNETASNLVDNLPVNESKLQDETNPLIIHEPADSQAFVPTSEPVKSTSTAMPVEQEPSFVAAIADWSMLHKLTLEAIGELEDILKRYDRW